MKLEELEQIIRMPTCVPMQRGGLLAETKRLARTLLILAVFVCISSNGVHAATFFGFEHTPLGGATLTQNGGNLVVGNLGSSGNDGVSIDIPPSAPLWKANWLPLGDATSHPDNSFFRMTTRGSVGGTGGQPISVITTTDMGSTLGIDFDFTPMGATGVEAEYFLNNTLVHSESLSGSGRLLAAADFWPDDAEVTWTFPLIPDAGVTWDFSSASVETAGGTLLSIDRVHLTAMDGSPINYESVDFTTRDIPSFTITGESSIPEPNVGALLILTGIYYITRRRVRNLSD